MKWLEVIELRASECNRTMLESELQNLIYEFRAAAEKKLIKSYTSMRIVTDFSVHLIHDSKAPEMGGSQLGLHLASALKAYGLVNHSVWVEMQRT